MVWLTVPQLLALPHGTAVILERTGARHNPRIIGRITGSTPGTIELSTPRGESSVDRTDIRRGRIVGALYQPGDPVLLRHVAASLWRGGVVRTDGARVLVEQLDGKFVWYDEDAIEPADARDPSVPTSPRGRVPARVV